MLLSAILAAQLRRRSCHSQGGTYYRTGGVVEDPEDSIEAEKSIAGDAGGKAGGARPDDEPPLANGLSQSVAVKHGASIRIV